MSKTSQTVKTNLHPANMHRHGYDFDKLCRALPALKSLLITLDNGHKTLDFSDPESVKCLNQALLKEDYQIDFWDIPTGYLCPAIPGRVDYLHYIADLLGDIDEKIVGFDIGTGASCIYPLLGASHYGWYFKATDIDPVSIKTAQALAKSNKKVANKVKVVLQNQSSSIFKGIVKRRDYFHFSMCNPPFHSSLVEAEAGSLRKIKNLTGQKVEKARLNFGGQKAELWCEGGEVAFISKMIDESVEVKSCFGWFTTLVSKKDSLAPLKKQLEQVKASDVKVINMSQGQKVSRILCWRFN